MPAPLAKSLRALAEVHDAPRFRSFMIGSCLVGLAIALVTEVLAYVSPEFPKDILGSSVMGGAFATALVAAWRNAPRRVLGWVAIGLFGVMGWYIGRAMGMSGGATSPHRDSLYAALAAAQLLLAFSALEFGAVVVAFVGAYVVTMLGGGYAEPGDFGVMFVYIVGFGVLSMIAIVGRTRLQRSELQAREQLRELNENLQSEVERQVEQLRRAELLGRYLPPQISEQVLAGQRAAELEHARREVTIVCAVPFGFLESLSAIDADKVPPLVNGFVAEVTRLAHEYGGVLERFVGPRLTVLFGAIEREDPADAARRAARMALAMLHQANVLLAEWERGGHALRLRMAIGIASGTCVVGTFGGEQRVEYSALGGAMVRAHRLASVAIPGEVRLDEHAAELIRDVVRVADAAPIEFSPGRESQTFLLAPSVEGGAEAREPSARQHAIAAADTWTAGTEAVQSTILETLSQAREVAPIPSLDVGGLFDGRYRIDRRIGRGGMGAVYQATHTGHGTVRALKLIAPERLRTPEAVEQFRREAESTARLHHPNVVQLHDFGRSLEGYYYLALEYIDGRSLAAELRARGPLPPGRAVAIGTAILEALHAAHELRIVHRDVKPANVLIDDADRVHVTDFGLAQPLGAAIDLSRPVIVGTPAYMSPEQCQGRVLDGRSDLYSFGVTLYEMLSGAIPYDVDTQAEVIMAVLGAQPVPLLRRAPHAPPVLWEIIERCLRKDPAQRPTTAREVRNALRATSPALAELQ